MIVRAAEAADLPQVERIHRDSWQSAYRGMVSDAFLKSEVPGIMARKWAAMPAAEDRLLVAEAGDALAGFVALIRDHEGGPYVDNLHVAPEGRGRGTGRLLMARLAGALLASGGDTLWLTVIRENGPSRAFYRAIGGVEGPGGWEDLFGQPVFALPVHWPDRAALERLAGLG